jgi:hypothetical protein
MKQIHVWPNHVSIPHADLVLVRSPSEPVDQTLARLARLGFDARESNVEFHGDVVRN